MVRHLILIGCIDQRAQPARVPLSLCCYDNKYRYHPKIELMVATRKTKCITSGEYNLLLAILVVVVALVRMVYSSTYLQVRITCLFAKTKILNKRKILKQVYLTVWMLLLYKRLTTQDRHLENFNTNSINMKYHIQCLLHNKTQSHSSSSTTSIRFSIPYLLATTLSRLYLTP